MKKFILINDLIININIIKYIRYVKSIEKLYINVENNLDIEVDNVNEEQYITISRVLGDLNER